MGRDGDAPFAMPLHSECLGIPYGAIAGSGKDARIKARISGGRSSCQEHGSQIQGRCLIVM